MDDHSVVQNGSQEYAFPGYTLQEDFTLQPEIDEKGDIVNPDLILAPGVLCDVCKQMILKAEAWHEKQLRPVNDSETIASVPFHDSAADIRSSIERGCCICTSFIAAEKSTYVGKDRSGYGRPNSLRDAPQSYIQFANNTLFSMNLNRFMGVKKRIGYISLGSSLDLISLGVQPREESDRSPAFLASRSASNASTATLSTARSWIETCKEEHSKCRPDPGSYEIPKRLLDVGDSAYSRLQIILPRKHTPYLTVSHCWGAVRTLELDSRTEEKLTKGFSNEELPRLFRDCVNVTRRLGFRYLWIDRLCILQDNEQDKKEEITKMGAIYQGSVCNIAAVAATDGAASLFTKYLPTLSTRLTVEDSPPSTKGIFEAHAVNVETPSPLFKRAWVIQERLLAPCTLEFTRVGLRWRCSEESLKRNKFRSISRLHVDFPDVASDWTQLLELRSTQMSEEKKCVGQDSWMRIVEQYTRAELTFEKDRGVALLGVISVLQERTGLSLLHGLVKDFLPYSLLWWTPERLRDLTLCAPYPLPSWSSTFRPERSQSLFHKLQAKDVRLHCSQCSIDEQTSVLSLKAKYLGSRMIRWETDDRDSVLLVQNMDGEWVEMDMFDSKSHWAAAPVLFLTDYKGFPPTEVDLVLLGHTPSQEDEEDEAYGLICSKVSGEDGLWERIGLFDIEECDVEINVLPHFQQEKMYRIR